MKKIKILVFVSAGAVLLSAAVCGCGRAQNDGEKKEEYVSQGQLYSVEEAYENGLINSEDLRDIAYYYHSARNKIYDEGYVPNPKNPEFLDEETEKQIKITYLIDVIKMPELELDYIDLDDYYGAYRENIAVGIGDHYFGYDILIEPEYEIGGITFYEFSTAAICIWVKNIS